MQKQIIKIALIGIGLTLISVGDDSKKYDCKILASRIGGDSSSFEPIVIPNVSITVNKKSTLVLRGKTYKFIKTIDTNTPNAFNVYEGDRIVITQGEGKAENEVMLHTKDNDTSIAMDCERIK